MKINKIFMITFNKIRLRNINLSKKIFYFQLLKDK